MSEERLLVDTVLDMTAASVERAGLDGRELMMVRMAALAAVGAPTGSYLLNIVAAAETEMTIEDARSVLIAVAPIIGSPKVMAAAGTIADALDIASTSRSRSSRPASETTERSASTSNPMLPTSADRNPPHHAAAHSDHAYSL